MPAFPLPGNKTKSGFRTQSTPGGGGYNELSFEDASANERIYLHAQRDLDEEIERDHTRLVRGSERTQILGGRVDIVSGDARSTVRGSVEEQIAGDRTTQVEGSRLDVVTGNADERVSGMLVTRVEGRERRDVQGNADLEHAEDLTTRVHGCMTTIVGEDGKKRSWLTHAEGMATLSSLDATCVSSEGEILLRVGKSSIRITSERIELISPAISVKGEGAGLSVDDAGLKLGSKGDAQLVVEKKLVLKTSDGASISMEKEVQVQGKKILLNSPASATDSPAKEPEPPTTVELVDQDGNALAYQRFVVVQDDGAEVGGITDKDGKAELELDADGKIVFPEVTMPGDVGCENGEMVPYVVARGDYLAKLAFVHGFDAEKVWNDPKNGDLRQMRPDPNILACGDVLQIPKLAKKELPIGKATMNRYAVNVPKVKVELLFRDENRPLAGEPVEVLGLGQSRSEDAKSVTDGEGRLSLDVPVIVRTITVDFPQREGLRLTFFVGDIDPVSISNGLMQRLVSLGELPSYYDRKLDEAGVLLVNALATFREKNGIESSCEVDDATLRALVDCHMC